MLNNKINKAIAELTNATRTPSYSELKSTLKITPTELKMGEVPSEIIKTQIRFTIANRDFYNTIANLSTKKIIKVIRDRADSMLKKNIANRRNNSNIMELTEASSLELSISYITHAYILSIMFNHDRQNFEDYILNKCEKEILKSNLENMNSFDDLFGEFKTTQTPEELEKEIKKAKKARKRAKKLAKEAEVVL
jgi:hypothetical protein